MAAKRNSRVGRSAAPTMVSWPIPKSPAENRIASRLKRGHRDLRRATGGHGDVVGAGVECHPLGIDHLGVCYRAGRTVIRLVMAPASPARAIAAASARP